MSNDPCESNQCNPISLDQWLAYKWACTSDQTDIKKVFSSVIQGKDKAKTSRPCLPFLFLCGDVLPRAILHTWGNKSVEDWQCRQMKSNYFKPSLTHSSLLMCSSLSALQDSLNFSEIITESLPFTSFSLFVVVIKLFSKYPNYTPF